MRSWVLVGAGRADTRMVNAGRRVVHLADGSWALSTACTRARTQTEVRAVNPGWRGRDYSHVVRVHSGNGPHEQMDGRAVAAFVLALDDVGVSSDPRLRFQLIAWFTWATAVLNHRWPTPEDVPGGIPLPSWDWDGTEGW